MTSSVLNLLRCPVCGADGETDEVGKRFFCHGSRQHSFDFAKSGYLNLCLNAITGDSKDAIRARTAFLEAGYYRLLSDSINEILAELGARSVLDAGCGEGYYTNRMTEVCDTVFGADLSKDGVDRAAKTAKQKGNHASFAVANLFSLPIADGSFDAVTNLFAPCCEAEFSRILKSDGHLIVVGAGERHLLGLKKLLYDDAYLNPVRNDLPERLMLCDQRRIQTTVTVQENSMIQSLFSMTPYYWRTSESDRAKLNGIESLETELDFDVYVYRKDVHA
ncbi:MAG: methyltransferase domain-containing protein [Clostridia bacterium]|nr:methyltransferase domain-containing protein [Clostridia bacterium]